MILTGVLKRVGGGVGEASRSGPTFIDALEVDGHPEIRNVRGTRYIIDHVTNAVGENVSIGLLGKAIVAVKHDGGLYSGESVPSLIISNAPLLIGAIIASMALSMFFSNVAIVLLVAVYFVCRHRVKTVVSAVSASS